MRRNTAVPGVSHPNRMWETEHDETEQDPILGRDARPKSVHPCRPSRFLGLHVRAQEEEHSLETKI